MNILITGSEGYIGSKIKKKLSFIGNNIYCVDLKKGLDITSFELKEEIDIVFHLAALPSVQFSVENPSYSLRHNVLGTSKALELAKNCGAKKFIFSSSAAVYGENGSPNSPYGMHKLMSEMECRLYSELYDLDTVCLRYFNIFSEDQKYGGAYSTVISAWMEMLRKSRSLRIDGDGSQSRDFIHVDDIVSANLFCMNYEERFSGRCFDVGLGREISLLQIKNIIDERQKRITWNYSPSRSGDIKNSCADLSKGLQVLGWKPKIDPIKEFEEYFSKNFRL